MLAMLELEFETARAEGRRQGLEEAANRIEIGLTPGPDDLSQHPAVWSQRMAEVVRLLQFVKG